MRNVTAPALPALVAVNEAMAAPDASATIEVVAERLMVRIESLIAARFPAATRKTTPATRRFLSLREAAAVLGIDRNTTLKTLIDEGRIRTVTVGDKPKVPMSEVERIEREGTRRPSRGAASTSQPKLPSMKAAEAPLARDAIARIAAIKV